MTVFASFANTFQDVLIYTGAFFLIIAIIKGIAIVISGIREHYKYLK